MNSELAQVHHPPARRGLLSEIARDSTLTGGGLLASAVLSFAFTFVVARALGPESYGWLGALLGVYGFATVCSGAIMPAVTSVVAESWTADKAGAISALLRRAGLVCLGVVGLLAIAGVLAGGLVSPAGADRFAFGAIGALLGLTFLVAVSTATLRGVRRFRALAALLALDPLARLTVGVVLVGAGLGVDGALGAYLVGTLVFLLGGLIAFRDLAAAPPGPLPTERLGRLSRHGAVLTAAQAAYTATPPVLAWRLLGGDDAGYVVAAFALANVMVPFLDAISTTAYPRMVVAVGAGHSARAHFGLAIGLIGATGVVAAGVLVFAGDPIVRLVYGSAFAPAVALLPGFALSRVLLGLLTAFTSLGFAESRFTFTYAWLATAVLQILALLQFGQSPAGFAWVVLGSTALCFLVLSVEFVLWRSQRG